MKIELLEVVEYEESFGEICFPEGFEERLRGKTLEEQAKCYRTTDCSEYSVSDYKTRTSNGYYTGLEYCPDIRALIVKDGILVGVMMVNDDGRMETCLPGERVCTYYADDNDGAGSKTRIDYTWLVCVPEDF